MNRPLAGAQSGLSLIELMVAMTLSLLLIGGVLQIFLTTKQTYNTNMALARVQETGRFAMQFLAYDARSAGYKGECLTSPERLLPDEYDDEDARFDFSTPVVGWGSGNNKTSSENANIPASIPSDWSVENRVAGTDAILVKYAALGAGTITGEPSDTRVPVSASSDIPAKQLLVIANPQTCNLFENDKETRTAVEPSFGTLDTFPYNEKEEESMLNPSLLKVTTALYYIGTNARGIPALYRVDYSVGGEPNRQELVDGIQTMRIQYAIGNSDGAISGNYKDASDMAASDWASVVSVRIKLLAISSQQHVVTPDQVLKVNLETLEQDDENTTAIADGRLAQLFVSTIGIRNRLP